MMNSLLPPRDPPASNAGGSFSWRRGLAGAGVGALVGLAAHFLQWSPWWWWLAVPVGFLLASASFQFQFAIKWGRK